MARYREIAEDMRARIAAGEWPVGERMPTLPQLHELYGSGMNTVREAERLLVIEGLLRSDRQAGGMVVVATPPPRRGGPDTPPVRDELLRIQHTIARMLPQLPEDPPALPYVVDEKRQPRPLLQFFDEQTTAYPGRVWAPMTGWRCNTCGTEGGQERGWTDPPVDEPQEPARRQRRRPRRGAAGDGDGARDGAPPESCVTEAHDLTRWHGPDPAAGKRVAQLHELELERNAHAKEAIRLLDLIHPDAATLTGYIAAARWHARQATKLSRKLSGV